MAEGAAPRRIAVKVLERIENDGAFANLVLNATLEKSKLDSRDRAFVTEMVYGTTRMRRACDHTLDRFLHDEIEPLARTILRLGVWQIIFGGVPAHAAVSATVEVAPRRFRGLCNAVLRRIAENPVTDWPSEAIELSYPDWLMNRLKLDVGEQDALGMAKTMNEPALAVTRSDGYHQDLSSQMVAESAVEGLKAGDSILDLCAAPGGKATLMASGGVWTVAADVRESRMGLVAENVQRLNVNLSLVVSDGCFPPFKPKSFNRVLVDAPCSGLGVLRRRADARWRVSEEEIERLSFLQEELLLSALNLVASGGQLIYSVCTVTSAETTEVDERFRTKTGVQSCGPLPDPWRIHGQGGMILPQDLNSEGMAIFRYHVE